MGERRGRVGDTLRVPPAISAVAATLVASRLQTKSGSAPTARKLPMGASAW
jgi:hypothetical protein